MSEYRQILALAVDHSARAGRRRSEPVDRSRATLRAGSALEVQEFGYSPAEPERGSVIMRFLRGSMRMVTGLVARARPSAFRMGTQSP